MFRLSAGPTVDSLGHVGGEIRITAGMGVGPVLVPVALHTGAAETAQGSRAAIGGGAAIELAGCATASHFCAFTGVGFVGRSVDSDERLPGGFGLSWRLGAYGAPYARHSGPSWLLHLSSDRALAIGVEVDLTGYVATATNGGVFFFGVSGLALAQTY